jgi:uncharacterized protein HemX
MSDTDKEQKPNPPEEEVALDEEHKPEPAEDDAALDEEHKPEPAEDESALGEEEETGEFQSIPAAEPPTAGKPPGKRGNVVAWLALLVSLIALAAVAYTVSRDWLAAGDTSAENALARVDNRVSAAQQALNGLDARIQELDAKDGDARAEVDALRQELDERVRLLSSLPARMTTLESSVASLAGISEGARDAWLIAEAEYYMQIANAQLQLANNPELAALALSMADERVVQMGNPALIDVRRAISDELAALDLMEKPDIVGATLTLASLAHVVESLPIASSRTADDAEEQALDEEQSSLNRAWMSIKNAMSGLVKVTPPDEADLTLISPDAEFFLRGNLALQLQSARLALLRGEQAVFEQSVDDTHALLAQYFDSDSAQVASAQETLTEIRNNVFTSAAPDISGSLQLLRQFQTLRENSQ